MKRRQLSERSLSAAEIVTITSNPGESPFQTATRFAGIMYGQPRMHKEPVYGINDWYFTYGNNSEKSILEHSELMVPMAEGFVNSPFSVVDAGWFHHTPSVPNDTCWGDNMIVPNAQFGDMSILAEKIKKAGMRPEVWTRPLYGSHNNSKMLMLPLIMGRSENGPVHDPTIPENLERIANYFSVYRHWGYDLIKFDFTSGDLFGKWGYQMLKDRSISSGNWRMADQSKTNAEIVLNLYKRIRKAAGESYIIGCNTFSHLAAGLFELNSIGDDTSGNEWSRTPKIEVNTLAFRGIQHGKFYSADPDCVGHYC